MLVVLILLLVDRALCARILAIFPTTSISHQIVFQPIFRELSLRGHQVLVFTPDPLKNSSLTNLTEIDMSTTYNIWRGFNIIDKVSKDRHTIETTMFALNKEGEIVEEHLKRLTEMLTKSMEFDLLLLETLHPLLYSVGCKFKVPIIGVSSFGVFMQTHEAVGNPIHPLVSFDIFSNVMGEMGLYEKIYLLTYNIWYRLVYHWSLLPRSDKIAKSYWGDHCPYLGTLERNVSLILMNTNPVLHGVRPLVSNVIEMGQMHISTKKSLPKDLQSYLDSCTNGCVYLSFGTNVMSSNLPPTTRKIIVEALSELPYNFLWKWEEDTFPDKPGNVLISKWFPQQDVLGHPNLRAFVTQGGLQSAEEAISNGVPIIGVPFIADQPANVMRLVKLGLGKSLNYVTMTKEEVKKTIVEVVENSKYKENVRELQDVFSDQPMTGLEKSIWWIEYVLRHNGAEHLRSPAADLSWFEFFLLDIIGLLILFLAVVLFLVRWLKKQILNFLNKLKKILHGQNDLNGRIKPKEMFHKSDSSKKRN